MNIINHAVKVILCFYSFSAIHQSFGGELNGVKFEDTIIIEGKSLVLNGMAIRKVSKFGIPIKVYVVGLYLDKKESSFEKINVNDQVKHIEMEFVRNVDKDKIKDAWKEAIFKGCFVDCHHSLDHMKPYISEFNSYMGDMRQKQRMSITFLKDSIIVHQNGRMPKSGKVLDKSFSHNLLAIFIGPNSFSEEVRNGLLDLNKK